MKIQKQQPSPDNVNPLVDMNRGDVFKANGKYFLVFERLCAVNIASGETIDLASACSAFRVLDWYFNLPPRKRKTATLCQGNVVKIRADGYYYVIGQDNPPHIRARKINSSERHRNNVKLLAENTVIEQVWETVDDFVSEVVGFRYSWNPLECLPTNRFDRIPVGTVFTLVAQGKDDYLAYMKIDIGQEAVCLTETECGKRVRFEDSERVYVHNNATFVVVE